MTSSPIQAQLAVHAGNMLVETGVGVVPYAAGSMFGQVGTAQQNLTPLILIPGSTHYSTNLTPSSFISSTVKTGLFRQTAERIGAIAMDAVATIQQPGTSKDHLLARARATIAPPISEVGEVAEGMYDLMMRAGIIHAIYGGRSDEEQIDNAIAAFERSVALPAQTTKPSPTLTALTRELLADMWTRKIKALRKASSRKTIGEQIAYAVTERNAVRSHLAVDWLGAAQSMTSIGADMRMALHRSMWNAFASESFDVYGDAAIAAITVEGTSQMDKAKYAIRALWGHSVAEVTDWRTIFELSAYLVHGTNIQKPLGNLIDRDLSHIPYREFENATPWHAILKIANQATGGHFAEPARIAYSRGKEPSLGI